MQLYDDDVHVHDLYGYSNQCACTNICALASIKHIFHGDVYTSYVCISDIDGECHVLQAADSETPYPLHSHGSFGHSNYPK